MKKILDLNICICIVVTFLFEFLDGSNMIPSQYRLAIAAIILVFDAIFAIYAIIESRKKNHSIKMFLDDTVSTLVPAAILYLIIGLVYNFVKDRKSIKSTSKNNRLS